MAELVGVPLADLLRRGEEVFRSAGASVPLEDADALASWLHQHPQALERPIVVDEVGQRAVVGRPPENVESLLKS